MRSTSRGSRHVSKVRGPAATAMAAAATASALVAAMSRPALADPYVGVNFRGNQPTVTLEPTESTGVVPQANWNHANGNNGTGIFLNDANGAPTPISMSYTAQESWGTGVAPTTPAGKLFAGYLSAQNSQASTINLASVPLGFYDLILYTMRDANGTPQAMYSNSASGVVYRTIHDWRDNYNADPTFRRASSTDPNARQTGNYVRWDGLPVLSDLRITFTADTFRAPVNGFQLLTSTKPVKTWSGQVSGVWDTSTPNFSGQTFQAGDNLFFKDTNATGGAVATRDVSLSTAGATASGIIVDNSTGDYTFSGSLRGAGLSKAGTGQLTLTGPGDNTALGIAGVSGGTVVLAKASSPEVSAVASISNVAAGTTVRLAGTGGNQIADGGDVSNMNGTLDLGGNSERFGTLSGGGTVARTATPATLTLGSATNGAFSGTIQNTANLTLIKEGTGRQGISNQDFAGPVTVNGGTLELSSNARLSGPGVTLNGSGTRSVYPYASGPQTRHGALALTNLSVDPLGSTPVVMNGGEVIHNANGTVKEYTLQNVTAASGLNTFSNQPSGGAKPLTLGSLTRTRGATLEFKSNFGALGGAGDNGQVKITNLNGAPFAGNTNGIMGGWAIAYNGDGAPWDSYWATYDPATGVKPLAAADYATTLAGATAASNVRLSGPAETVSTDTTINSLVARNDNTLSIASGATLKVNSGGVIITYGNTNQVGGAGNITTGLASGELFVHSYDSAYAENDRFQLNARVVDNAGTPTTLVKSGYGPLTINGGNTHTGGTIVNSGVLTVGNQGSVGTGPVTVAPGATLALDNNTNVNNPLTLNGTSPLGALRSRAGGGGAQSYYNGTITLARTSNVSSTDPLDNLVLRGQITGPGGLTVSGGKAVLGNPTNDYLGDTTVGAGALLWAADPLSGGAIPSGPGKGNVIVHGTLDIVGRPQTINGLSGGGVVTNEFFDTADLTVGAGNASSTFGGVIKGGDLGATINLTKVGTGTITLSGNNGYSGPTNVQGGTLAFAKTTSLYGGNSSFWTPSNIVVDSGATLGLNVGGSGEFTTSDVGNLVAMSTATGGFKSGSSIGIDTTNAPGGNLNYSAVLANPNGGANSLGLAKLGSGSLTLTAANTYSGGTNVRAGTLNVANVRALGTGGLAIANGATARLAPNLPQALDLPSQPAMTASGTTGGTLNLTDNALVVRHANQAAAFAGHAAVNNLTRNAFNEFAWNQPGVTSTTVAADVANGIPAAVGILLNNDGGGNPLFYGNGTDLPQFEGRSVDGNSVLVKPTLLGDGDLNGVVDTVDFALFQAGYTNSAPYVGFAFGDYDYNGVVDTVDFGLFQAGYQYSQASGGASAEMVAFATEHGLPLVAAVVPEPAAFGLLALAGGGLLAGRRRRPGTMRSEETNHN